MNKLENLSPEDLQAIEEIVSKGVSISDILTALKGESTYWILRYGVKSPSKSGMDDCEDSCYYDLYNIVHALKK